MGKVVYQGRSEIEIKARPDQVWAILEDSTRLPDWAPMIKGTTGKIEKVGSLRTCQVEWEVVKTRSSSVASRQTHQKRSSG